MKTIQYLATASILACLVGCASTARVAVQEPVGPCQRIATVNATEGSLVVHSARRQADVDPVAEEFFRNNDFGKNEFMYEPAHTDYTIQRSDGTVFKRVRNAVGRNNATPTSVSLPPGNYTVEAEAEMEGLMTMTVLVPVVIEAGQTTMVHLEPTRGRSAAAPELGNVVRLSDGRVIGCRAQPLLGLNTR